MAVLYQLSYVGMTLDSTLIRRPPSIISLGIQNRRPALPGAFLGQLLGALLGKNIPRTSPERSLQAQQPQQTRDLTSRRTSLATYGKERVRSSSRTSDSPASNDMPPARRRFGRRP